MKIRVQINHRLETRIAWKPVQRTILVAALDFGCFYIALRPGAKLVSFYSIFLKLAKVCIYRGYTAGLEEGACALCSTLFFHGRPLMIGRGLVELA
jgi:hypothetical protein